MQTGQPPFAFSARRGSALVLVLVILLFAALALALFVERAGVELLSEAKQADRDRLRPEAYAALEVTLATLADFRAIDGALFAPAQGWEEPLDYARYQPGTGTTIEVRFEDESGKLSLPRATADQLVALFKYLGEPEDVALRLTDALLLWMRPDHNPTRIETDPGVYERATPPRKVPQRSLRSFAELASIAVARDYFYDEHGQPTPLWEQFRESVSLYSFEGGNLNTAGAGVLAAGGLDSTQINQLLDNRASGSSLAGAKSRYFRSVDEAQATLGSSAALPGFGANIKALRVIITAREGPGRFELSAVITAGEASFPLPTQPAEEGKPAESPAPPVNPPKKLDYPFTVLAISERTGEALSAPPVQ